MRIFLFFCSTVLFGWIAVDDEDGFQYLSNRPVWLDARLSDSSVGIFRLEPDKIILISEDKIIPATPNLDHRNHTQITTLPKRHRWIQNLGFRQN